MDTLHDLYYENKIGSVSSGFSDFLVIGEQIESVLKSENIKDTLGIQSGTKKFSNNFQEKKELETNVIMESVGNSYQVSTKAYHPPHFQQPPPPVIYYMYPYVTATTLVQYP